MSATLNKDGTPRKLGSGKTKGAGCFAKIKWNQLREFIRDEDDILVSRVWLRSVGALNQKKGSKKKLMPSTPYPSPSANLPKHIPPDHARAKPTRSKATTETVKEEPEVNIPEEDEYDPPPLFASIGKIKKY